MAMIGTCSMLALNWVVCANIYKLTISIKNHLSIVNKEKCSKKKRCFYRFACLMILSQFLSIVLINYCVD